MKKIFILMLLIGMPLMATANNAFLSNRNIQEINNNQAIDFDLNPGQSTYFKVWIPHNAAHLKIHYLTQSPNVFMWTNFGSTPALTSGQSRPDCEFPAFSNELLGIPYTLIRCVFERPQSGAYHFIKIFNEGNQPTNGLSQLYVSYQANGLPQVATVSMKADYLDYLSGQQDTAVAHGISGDIANHLERSFVMLYDESLGRFEERSGGRCDAAAAQNPTYLELELLHSEPIDSCTYRGSWDEQARACSSQLVNAINNTQRASVLNTDDYQTIVMDGQCFPDVDSPHMPAGHVGVPNNHWFEFTPVIRGQSYSRRFLIRKVNGTY